MITFLVFSIIVTVISASASLIVTLALSYWDVAVDLSDCTTVGDSCVCPGDQIYGGMLDSISLNVSVIQNKI